MNKDEIVKRIIAVVIVLIAAAVTWGITVPRHFLNTLGIVTAVCDDQTC
jgi:hypothetical protein